MIFRARRISGELRFGLRQQRAVAGEVRLGLRQRRLERAPVKREQLLSRPDGVAFSKGDVDQLRGDL